MKQVSKARSAGAGLIAICAAVTFTGLVSAKGGLPNPPSPPKPPVVKPVDPRKAAFLAVPCTQAGAGTLGFNKSGARVTLSLGVDGGAPATGWTITVTDSLAGVMATSTVGATGSAWSAIVNYDSPKGNRTVNVAFAAIDGSNSCVGTVQYNV